MSRRIRKVAVLGSGVMGSGIACHFANIGIEVLMLDIVPRDLSAAERDQPAARNRLADEALKTAIRSKPAPLYKKDFAARITTGNFEDHLEQIVNYDWVIEVIIERLDIKQQLYEQVDRYRRKGTLVTSNTSGIPIHLMTEGRSADFQRHFCGTHFFNPPRYLRLLEIIPHEGTSDEVVDFLMQYGSRYLGKQTVLAKDTPAFIGNRVGVYAMANIFRLTEELGLTITEVDKLTGPLIGRPKTGTFRLADLVGHDTSANVIRGIKERAVDDEQAVAFSVPGYLHFLLDNKFLGNKTGKGFYEKTGQRDEKGRPVILALDLQTLEYAPTKKPQLEVLRLEKKIPQLKERLRAIIQQDGPGAQLIKRSLGGLFAYVSQRIPEISDNIYSIDNALKAGFAWEMGPFEYWDAIGLKEGIALAEDLDLKVADWVKVMLDQGIMHFYQREEGERQFYDIKTQHYWVIPGTEDIIKLENFRERSPVHRTSETILHDIGDGVLCLEFTSPHNSIGEGVLRGIQESIQLAEDGGWKGLVIGNDSTNFSVGANLMLIGMLAVQEDFDQMEQAVSLFQQTTMRCRYSAIPVVVATQGYVFGGGCEILMHCDAAVAAAESYIGLVEVGVGLLPGGAGTKEFAVRVSDAIDREGDLEIPTLIEHFKAIALAQVSTSAYEAYDYNYLQRHRDDVVINRDLNLKEAKQKVLEMAKNYTQPIERTDVRVLGRTGLGALYIAANELRLGHYASDHDIKIAKKIAYVLCGGDLTSPQHVSEQYLIDLEREAFLSLAAEPKTQQRIQHMITTNKPLRN